MVACDSDYADFEEDFISHPLIVTTYGHSIENTMFCIPMMSAYLSRLKATDLYERISAYLEQYDKEFYDIFTKDNTDLQLNYNQSDHYLTIYIYLELLLYSHNLNYIL